MKRPAANVFINCPFDEAYKPLLEALLFTITASGYRVRCALEESDSGAVRFDKICRLIRESEWSVHDLSRTELSKKKLPRFNMPFEFGLFLGAKQYGLRKHKLKKSLVIGRRPYEIGIFLSDTAGSDHAHHRNRPKHLIRVVRDHLHRRPDGTQLPGATDMTREFGRFKRRLPTLAAGAKLKPNEVDAIANYRDYMLLLAGYLAQA